MAGDLLNIGKSGLFAAQAGLATTGHNIANAGVAGYSRQTVIQGSLGGQNVGYGFVGSGTQVTDIKRFSDSFLNAQVRSAQATSSALTAYGSQASQIDNMLADSTSGLSPALQDFFKSVQDVSASAGSTASRQAFLSSADSLATRFQSMSTQLDDIKSGVNTQITANVASINSYAGQIATLNSQIGALSSTGATPNDLIDARDQLLLELNKHVKATSAPGSSNTVTVTIGSGQPLVVGERAYQLAAVPSPDDASRMAVAYVTGNRTTVMADAALTGGELGGLLEFRSSTLDGAQNALGRVAITLAASFNAQQALGQTASGKLGDKLFADATPLVLSNDNPVADPVSPTAVAVTVSDVSKLTTSDYSVDYDSVNSRFTVTRLSDKQRTDLPAYTQPGPQSVDIDGLSFSISGIQAQGDSFTVRPTANGAANFKLLTHDVGAIAAAAPVISGATIGNKGSVKVGEATVDKTFLTTAASFAPSTLSYQVNTNSLSGFAAGQVVTVKTAAGSTAYTAGTNTIPYVDGATYSFDGVSMSMSGTPIDGDSFTVARTAIGGNDNRNMLAMGQLQSKTLLDNGSATLQGAFAQLVSTVGNKTREVQVSNAAATTSLAQATAIQQSVSGVNLDEEAANLLKYQQAYQAAGKVMQIASSLFDTLLSLGR
ncbi:flagellar hook-associated protein FlgK [Massilia sp. DWR3-1-1]|uniref:flagellar hook-associated protein FlgK n=1 Tax=Massilia sp. DWR3-1-1 TaxID=2804559 RepID=UPI003CEDD3FF